MERTYWQRQTLDKPLFEDILWSRPENKVQAGKLLIIGGNLHAFSAVATSYQTALKSGAGSVKILLPDALQKTVGHVLPDVEFAPSTPSGSFAQNALDSWLQYATWADAVLLPGDLGRNSETAIVLETFLKEYTGQVIITRDAEDYFRDHPLALLNRENTLVAVSFADLQKLAKNAGFERAFTYDMDFMRLIETLHELTTKYPAGIIVLHHSQLLIAKNGQLTSTDLKKEPTTWRTEFAAKASVFWMQNPSKILESVTSSFLNYNHPS